MRAKDKTFAVQRAIYARTGVLLDFDDAHTLRRAERTLHTWAEQECGDGYSCITRDEATGKPYREISGTSGKSRRYPVPDLEAGALRRVRDVCRRNGLEYYHQTDPRGCALYVASQARGMDDSNYNTAGVAVIA